MKKLKKATVQPTITKVDKDLDKYLKKDLFKDKIAKANHVLKTVGIPKFTN